MSENAPTDWRAQVNNPFDAVRKMMIESGQPAEDLADVEEAGEEKWDTYQLQQEFKVEAFAAPFVIAVRKSDGKRGSLEFTHSPRVYFNWKPFDE